MSGIMQMLLAAVQRVTDPFFEYVTLLLPGNGTNGAQNNTFLDSSTNNFTITRNGNTTQGTFSPFSQTGWGSFFPGTSGSYLSFANSSLLNIGSGDFTAECWIYPTTKSNNTIFYKGPVTGATYDYFLGWDGTTFTVIYGGTTSAAVTDTVQLNQWNHVALVRNTANSTLRVYINGTQTYSATYSGTYASTSGGAIGGTPTLTNTYAFNGYISNVRIAQSAIYTANFTPPTSPLTAITNTSLLTCQSNRFIDNSTNNFAITRNGDVSVQAFSPFNPTAAWSAATNGGSGYFDGSGDALTAADNAALDMGSSNFTIECWAYLTTTGSDYGIVSKWNQWGTAGTNSYLLYYSSAGNLEFLVSTGGTIGDIVLSSAATLRNTWVHIAAVRSGSNFALFANGTRLATASSASSVYDSTQLLRVGEIRSSVSNFPGYLSNVRIVKGTAVYDPTQSTLTVPTAPLTAIANTQLLLSCTNAGIYDATSKNDLETVGNAQISTTQSKFGGSSMYFDGTDDYLFSRSSRDFEFGTGDFTIEAWFYLSSTAGNYRTILALPHSAGGVGFRFGDATSYNSLLQCSILGTAASNVYSVNKSKSQLLNTWTHFALTRQGTTCRAFVNGVQENVGSGTNVTSFPNASFTDSTNIIGNTGAEVGRGFDANTTFIGYIQDVRITKGVARYTSTFTPPAAAFPVL